MLREPLHDYEDADSCAIGEIEARFAQLCAAAFNRHPDDKRGTLRLKKFGDELWSSGGRIPARAAHPDRPWVTFIAKRLDVQQSELSTPEAQKTFAAMVQLLPFAVTRWERPAKEIIVDELHLLGLTKREWSATSLTGKACKKAIGRVQAACDPHGNAVNALTKLVNGPPGSTPADIVLIGRMLLRHLATHIADDGLPNDTRARIRILAYRRGESTAELAREIGADYLAIKDKIHGLRNISRRDRGWLVDLEQHFGVAAGDIADRDNQYGKRGVGNPTSELAKDMVLTNRERTKLALFLPPDYAFLSDEQKSEHATVALALVGASVPPSKAAHALLRADGYRLKLGEAQRYEREALSVKRHYASPLKPTGVNADRSNWTETSFEMRVAYGRSIGGFLTSSALRGRAKLPIETFSIAHLMSPEVLEAYLRFRTRRRQQAFKSVGLETAPAITEEHIDILYYLSVLFHPENGWATQASYLQLRLTTIMRSGDEAADVDEDAGGDATWLISPNFVREVQGRARIDEVTGQPALDKNLVDDEAWRAACKKAYDHVRQMIRNQRKATRISRDSHEPVDAVLRSADPMSAWRMAVAGLRGELRQLQRDTKAYAETLRDLVTIQVVGQAGFRRRTVLSLDWRANNTGHLRKTREGWRLQVPRELFKAPESSYFIDGFDSHRHAIYRDYDERLLDVDGFYDELELYLDRYRDILRGDIDTDAFLLGSRNSNEARLTEGALDQMSRRIWVKHLIWNPLRRSGFEGVITTVRWHAWRHILATSVLKRCRDYTLAADAIQDSVDVCRQIYTRYVSSDRRRELDMVRLACLTEPNS